MNRFACLSVLLALVAAIDPALGQAVPPGGSQSAEPSASGDSSKKKTTVKDSSGLEEIVVTAERRESTVQKTPISMTAVSGADILARGLGDLQSIAQQTPGISFRTAGPGQTEYEMRGLTSTGGFSPTVGFYVDDAPLTAPSEAVQGKIVIDPDLYDLNRVEVLRGPQGTLYGSGSMGGTIKLVTNPPELNKFSVSAQTKDSDTDGGGFNYGVNAMLNIPLVQDVVALRLVGTDKYVAGWVDRVVLNPFPLETNGGLSRGNILAAPVQKRFSDVNWERLGGGRVGLLIQIGDRLTITPGAMYQRITQGGPNTADGPPGTRYAHFEPFDVDEPSEDVFSIYTLGIKYHFDAFDLSSASSSWNRHDQQQTDISETMQFLFGFPSYNTVGAGAQHIVDYSSQFSQEIRLASNTDGKFQWLGGVFFSDFHSNTTSFIIYPGFGPLFGTTNLINNTTPLTITQRALFGEASYKITDQLKGTLGLRYYRYASEDETTNSGIASIAGGPGTILEFGNARNSGFNPRVNFAYTLSDDMLLYTTAAKGFRPGGPNSPVPLKGPVQCLTGPGNLQSLGLTAAPNQFDPDGVWSYEVGEKARVMGNRVTINADIFYENWTNVQQAVDPSCGFSFTANAGAATIYGSEIEFAANLMPELTVTQNLGLTHATFNTTVLATGTAKGAKVLDVPNVTANTSIIYTKPVNANYNFNARATYNYVGPMQDITYVRNKLAGYSLLNARFGLMRDAFSAFVYVDNVTDKFAVLTNWNSNTVNVPIFNRLVVNQPRTIGVDFQFRY